VPLTHGNFAALSRLVTSPRTRTWVFLAVAALVTAIAAALTFRRAITPWSTLPDSDYWGNISGIVTESGVRLGLDTLLRHNNEHIVVIPKLVYAANYLVTSGSNTGGARQKPPRRVDPAQPTKPAVGRRSPPAPCPHRRRRSARGFRDVTTRVDRRLPARRPVPSRAGSKNCRLHALK